MSTQKRNTLTNKRYHANLWVDTCTELDIYQNAVMRALIRIMDRNYECYPSEKTLCRVTGIGSRNTISAATKALRKNKYLEFEKKKGKADFPCKHYIIKPPPEFIPGADGLTEAHDDTQEPLPELEIVDWNG